MGERRFNTGDHVSVRSAADILSTLDADGTLDGLPFMPEMLDWCGKPFRVLRRVEKTCVDGYPMRKFLGNDVVILDSPRCDGTAHDGCKHACRIFWKEAWLRPVESADKTQAVEIGLEELRARLKVKSDDRRYFCQSTELYRATGSFAPTETRYLTARIALREIRSGDVSAARMLKLLAFWFRQKLWRAAGGDGWLHGDLKRTPTQSLNLQPGDLVRVKSRDEIARTLDQRGRNRGIGICSEMSRCCGRRAQVRSRVDRLIDEKTGHMREISNTVTLTNVGNDESLAEECLCYGQIGDCPRGEIMYWREIWLERVNHDGASR